MKICLILVFFLSHYHGKLIVLLASNDVKGIMTMALHGEQSRKMMVNSVGLEVVGGKLGEREDDERRWSGGKRVKGSMQEWLSRHTRPLHANYHSYAARCLLEV